MYFGRDDSIYITATGETVKVKDASPELILSSLETRFTALCRAALRHLAKKHGFSEEWVQKNLEQQIAIRKPKWEKDIAEGNIF